MQKREQGKEKAAEGRHGEGRMTRKLGDMWEPTARPSLWSCVPCLHDAVDMVIDLVRWCSSEVFLEKRGNEGKPLDFNVDVF